MLFWLALAAAMIWLGLLVLPWQPWRMRERFVVDAARRHADLSDVTVLIPARDEAEALPATLAALARQGSGLQVIVVDDQSSDRTATVARRSGLAGLSVMSAEPLPPGWTGKLWALEQGRQRVATNRMLLLDADIEIAPGTVAGLRDIAVRDARQLVSLMAALRMRSGPEKLLIPAFVYFFKLLYPFALSNNGCRYVAAAAGGCALVDTATVARLGGFSSLRDAVIDDCTLAARVRAIGGRTWVAVTHAAVSRRGYPRYADIHAMVARSAFTQLHYSSGLLAGCTLIMGVMFWVAPVALLVGDRVARTLAGVAMLAMITSFVPTLRYYRLSPARALLLPVSGTLYLAMTWSSAWRYWRGLRAAWRGRVYRRDPP